MFYNTWCQMCTRCLYIDHPRLLPVPLTMDAPLPETHRALVFHSTSEPLKLEVRRTPRPTPGSAIVRILIANVISYMGEIYDGTRRYPFPSPLVTGTSAIGRIAAIGSDATTLKPGNLVLVDSTIRGRDDPACVFLFGITEGFTEGSRKLMHGEWRDATYAEYSKVPLENCIPMNEQRLLGKIEHGGLGYTLGDLAMIPQMLVPYGGLVDIDLKVGETVIVAPATGAFGGAAVLVALAMGARVIAMGRNVEALKRLAGRSDRVETVPMTADMQADLETLQTFGTIDAFFDISPPAAAHSTHFKSCILSLRQSGRVSLMGGPREDVPFPHHAITHRNLTLKGKWMYERADVFVLLKMVELGTLRLGEQAGLYGKQFALDSWKDAFAYAAANGAVGTQALIAP